MTTEDIQSLEAENYGLGLDELGFPKQSIDPIIEAQLKEQDRHFIKYRPEWNKYTGGPVETIVFLELLYWFKVSGFKPFYKFIRPAQHPQYKDGDSLVEATGCSYFQINKTIKQIGFKIGGKKPKDQIPNLSSEALIWYKQTQDRKTYWAINMDYYRIIYAEIMGGVNFPNSRNLNLEIQETEICSYNTKTTETTSPHSITTHTKGNLTERNLTSGEVSPHPSTGNSVGLQLTDTISDSRLAYLKDLAFKRDWKTLRRELTKATGAERDLIKNELLPFARGKKDRFELPETNEAPKTSVKLTHFWGDEMSQDEFFRWVSIKKGVRISLLKEIWETYEVWASTKGIEPTRAQFWVSKFLSDYDPFKYPDKVGKADITPQYATYYLLITEAGFSRRRARKSYYYDLLTSKETDPVKLSKQEYFNLCLEEGLVSAYEEYKAKHVFHFIDPDVEIPLFYFADEEKFFKKGKEGCGGDAVNLYKFYSRNGADSVLEYYKQEGIYEAE